MGKSVNTMMFTVDSDFAHSTYKFCAKCGAEFIEDTVDNMEDEFDSLTGKPKKIRYWGCPNYTSGPMLGGHEYRLYTGDIPTPAVSPTTAVKRSLKNFMIGKKDA